MMKEKELLKAEAVAKELKVSTSTVARWGRENKIPRIIISPKIIRYNLEAVILCLEGKGSAK